MFADVVVVVGTVNLELWLTRTWSGNCQCVNQHARSGGAGVAGVWLPESM